MSIQSEVIGKPHNENRSMLYFNSCLSGILDSLPTLMHHGHFSGEAEDASSSSMSSSSQVRESGVRVVILNTMLIPVIFGSGKTRQKYDPTIKLALIAPTTTEHNAPNPRCLVRTKFRRNLFIGSVQFSS